jgi:hypothetical protein
MRLDSVIGTYPYPYIHGQKSILTPHLLVVVNEQVNVISHLLSGTPVSN